MSEPHRRRSIVIRLLVLSALTTLVGCRAIPSSYEADIKAWREHREADLKADDGWLTVAGLFFLEPGENSFGSDQSNAIVLPAPAPPHIGIFEVRGNQTTVRIDQPAGVTINDGKPRAEDALVDDDHPEPDRIKVGTLTLTLHRSGERQAIRLRDTSSEIRRKFTTLKWFPIDPAYRVIGRFTPEPQPHDVMVPNTYGDESPYAAAGLVTFPVGGQEVTLKAMFNDSAHKQLYLIFNDLTSDHETYHIGRYLYADLQPDGTAVIDFNKAYNPPCAFNPYTTCPLPPPENRLKVRIEAGELTYTM